MKKALPSLIGRKSIARLIKENIKIIGIKVKNISCTRAISINQVNQCALSNTSG
jgi:hypothetical protein